MEKMDLEECSLITDATIIHLAMNCARLEKLVSAHQTLNFQHIELMYSLQSLSHCELITDEGIRHLSTSQCAAENLTALELDNCPFITDASLDHLISCYNLQRIELYDCQLITRAGIRRLRVGFSKCFLSHCGDDFFAEPLAQHQGTRLFCTRDSTAGNGCDSAALLPMLRGFVSLDFAPPGGWRGVVTRWRCERTRTRLCCIGGTRL